MVYGLSQCLMTAGLGLQVVGSIEGDPDLMVIVVPICVVGVPVKSRNVDCTIILNQLLLNKVVAIELGIAKLIS